MKYETLQPEDREQVLRTQLQHEERNHLSAEVQLTAMKAAGEETAAQEEAVARAEKRVKALQAELAKKG